MSNEFFALPTGSARRASPRRLALRAALAICVLAPLGMAAAPAQAQFSKAYEFLDHVKKGEAQDVQDALTGSGATLINTRDVTSGDTALIIVTRRRDLTWISFLLGKGADPNIRNVRDETPLTIAASLGFVEGVNLLLQQGAQPDQPDKTTGETPLIFATLRRDLPTIRALLAGGANPDRTDSTGRSAREYAERYGKDSAIAQALESAAKSKAGKASAYGPAL